MTSGKTIRTIAVMLCMAMLLSLGMAAFADEETADTAAAQEADTGIIDAAELQKMFDDYVAQYSLNSNNRSFSVGFCYLKTGDTWYYNEGKWYYSASLYKVPVSMLLAEREMAGEITADTVYENQYSTGSLDTLERKSIVNSNNDTGHAMVEWMGGTYNGKCADQLVKFTELPESYFNSDFYDYSYYNVEFYTEILKNLYEKQENYPRIIGYMKEAQPGAYLRTYLDGKYDVAQKYGAFEEVKAYPTKNNNHAGGIIYTPNPILVTVMTINVENYNNRIGEVAQMLTDYALKLDTKYDSYNAAQLAAAQEEARRAQEEADRLAAEAAAKQAEAEKAAAAAAAAQAQQEQNPTLFVNETPAPTAVPAAQSSGKTGMPGLGLNPTQKMIVIAGLAIFIIGLGLLIAALNLKRRHKYDDYDGMDAADYPEDDPNAYYDEDDADDYLEPPAVTRKQGRRMSAREEEYFQDYDYAAAEEAPAEDEFYGFEQDAAQEEYPQEDAEEYYPQEYAAEDENNADYLQAEDYLDDGVLVDPAEFDALDAEFSFDEHSAYADAEQTEEDSGYTNAAGNRYTPRH